MLRTLCCKTSTGTIFKPRLFDMTWPWTLSGVGVKLALTLAVTLMVLLPPYSLVVGPDAMMTLAFVVVM